jgi:hypothetical protein
MGEAVIDPEADDFWVDVAEAELEPPPWIIPGLIPPGLVFIGGPAKTLKTTLLVGIANLVSGHECGLLPRFMSKVERPGRCMILEAEAEPGEVRYMIEQDMGVQLEADGSILLARDCADFRLDDPGGVRRLLGWLEKYKPRLLGIDPMREFHDLDEKDSGDMQRLLRPLRRWAIANDCAIVVVHHTTKPGETHSGVYNPLDLRGSSALFGAANGVIMLSPTKVECRLVMTTKFKRGPSGTYEIDLGVFGQKAAEIFSKPELELLKVLRGVRRDASGLPTAHEAYLAQTLQVPERWVRSALEKMERNDLASRLVKLPKTWIANTEGVTNA